MVNEFKEFRDRQRQRQKIVGNFVWVDSFGKIE